MIRKRELENENDEGVSSSSSLAQQKRTVYGDTFLLQKYYLTYYPFDSIIRMLKMTQSKSLLQYRDLGLQPYQNAQYEMKKRFNRILDESLKEEMIKNNIPALHMGTFRPLSIQDYCYGSSGSTPLIYDKYFTRRGEAEISIPYKEMIFDIDITDYDRNFCSCHEMKSVCSVCWLHMEGTSIILNDILISRYGVDQKNIMWIFSGGKGIHCFVNDARMLKMSEHARMNLYDDIFVDNQDDYMAHCSKYHESQFYSPQLIKTLQELFLEKVLRERNLLFLSSAFEGHVLKKLSRYYNPSFYSMIQDKWQSIQVNESIEDELKSIKKWHFLQHLEYTADQDPYYLKPSIYIILSLYYPMIDKGPLRLSHLIKLPFSIHTKSGKVSLPIDRQVILDYNIIQSFPSLKSIINNTNPLLFKCGKEIMDEWSRHYCL